MAFLGMIGCLLIPPSQAQMRYDLDAGSVFIPRGHDPQPLSGSFEWVSFDTGVQGVIGMMLVGLHFEAPSITFDLDPSPPAVWATSTSVFPETGASFFGANVLATSASFPSGTYIMTTSWTDGLGSFAGPADHPTRVIYPWVDTGPVVEWSSTWIGRLEFSATAAPSPVIPEPRNLGLAGVGILVLSAAARILARRRSM